ILCFFFSSRRRHTRFSRDWSSDVCSSDLWNFLLAIMVGTTVAPVVVGNTVIVKPSPSTPVIAAKFMEMVAEAGFPPGVINLLTGADADIGDALVDHPRTRFINFTCSLATALRINERA